jgi:hypothetical protein
MPETYPIGRVSLPPTLDLGAVMRAIDAIERQPRALRAALDGCADLDHPIREGAWTIRQVVHHLADSHLHAFLRSKLACYEDGPTVPRYDVDAWASSPDTRGPVEPSLLLLDGLHARWVALWRGLGPAELERPWHLLQTPATYPVWRLALVYAWHGAHHTAQIERAREHYGI